MFDPSADPAHAQNRVRSTADGTVKQANPFTGQQVWTVPGRASRPLVHASATPAPLEPGAHAAVCDFCEDFCEAHKLPTPPERSRACEPWEHSPEEVRAVSDLLHAAHAATGAQVASNEEWHYRPVGLDVAMPWRIEVNTLSPFDVGNQATDELRAPCACGPVSASNRIGEECVPAPNLSRYNPDEER